MTISDFLSPANVLTDVRPGDKAGLLRELSELAARSLSVAIDDIARPLAQRETLGSTGLGGGVAIPHARLAGLLQPFGALVRLRKAIDFEAIDGQPVDLVFLLLMPTEKAAAQLNALASVARRLRDPAVVDRLRHARHAQGLFEAITA